MRRFKRDDHIWTFRCDRCGSRAVGPPDNLIEGKDLCDDCATVVKEAAEAQPSLAVDLLSTVFSTVIDSAVDYGLAKRRMSKCPRCRGTLDGFSCPDCHVDFEWVQEGDALRDGRLVERLDARSHSQPPPSQSWAPGWYETEHGCQQWDGAGWVHADLGPRHHWPAGEAKGRPTGGLTFWGHARHLLITLCTCGLWAPIWIWRARSRKRSRR